MFLLSIRRLSHGFSIPAFILALCLIAFLVVLLTSILFFLVSLLLPLDDTSYQAMLVGVLLEGLLDSLFLLGVCRSPVRRSDIWVYVQAFNILMLITT